MIGSAMTLDVHHSWRPSTSENNFLSRNLAEPVADARLCCARAPAHRHVAPRRPGSELFTWRCDCAARARFVPRPARCKGGGGYAAPANTRTSFSRDERMIDSAVPAGLCRSDPHAEGRHGRRGDSGVSIAVLDPTCGGAPSAPPADRHLSGGETPKLVGCLLRACTITRGDLPLQKTIFCLATLRSRLLMHGSAVRGLRLIATSRRGARDLSCSHGGDCAARKVRASASEVKGGGGYDHPLTHGPVFQRDKRIIERLATGFR